MVTTVIECNGRNCEGHTLCDPLEGGKIMETVKARSRKVRCIDCGKQFDPKDDDARCPASNGIAYHRSVENLRQERIANPDILR